MGRPCAYAHSYLPVVLLLSGQIDADIEERYARAQWTILQGVLDGKPWDSSYVFSQEILGYDLAGFFQRNSPDIKGEVQRIIQDLLE